jgi:hypothetical protein
MYPEPLIEKKARERFCEVYRRTFNVDNDAQPSWLIDLWFDCLREVDDEEREKETGYYRDHEKAVEDRVNGLLVQVTSIGPWHERRLSHNYLTYCGLDIPETGITEKDRKDSLARPICRRCMKALFVTEAQFDIADKMEG